MTDPTSSADFIFRSHGSLRQQLQREATGAGDEAVGVLPTLSSSPAESILVVPSSRTVTNSNTTASTSTSRLSRTDTAPSYPSMPLPTTPLVTYYGAGAAASSSLSASGGGSISSRMSSIGSIPEEEENNLDDFCRINTPPNSWRGAW